MESFLADHLDVVFFFYGLALLVLGLTVFFELRVAHGSEFKLLDILWLLAAFGVTHAIHEFADMFKVIKGQMLGLDIVNVVFMALSYALLLAFGYRLVNIDRQKLGAWFPALLGFFLVALPLSTDIGSVTTWNISSRYFLGLPGGLLSAVGLLLYYQAESEKLKNTAVRNYFIIAACFFGLYAILGGLFVPRAGFFPASVISRESFNAVLVVPIQAFRAVAAAGIAWSMWHVMNIFNLEKVEDIKRAQQALKTANETLEARVEARTAELATINQHMASEIKERKHAEKKLRSASLYARNLIEASLDPLATISTDGKIMDVNEATETVTGVNRDLLIGSDFCGYFTDPTQARNSYQEAFSKGTVTDYPLTIRHASGKVTEVLYHATVFRNEAGEVEGVFAAARDVSEQKKAMEFSQALNDMNALINSTLDFEAVMGTVTAEACMTVGCEGAGVLVREGDKWSLAYAHGYPRRLVGTSFSLVQAPGVGIAAGTGRSIVCNNVATDPKHNSVVTAELNLKSYIIAPLKDKEEAIGALFFSYHSTAKAFAGSEVDFATKLASSLSLSLVNARLFSTQRDIADTLQEALLAVPDKVPGARIGHLYQSATEAAKVGGDFYDVFELDHDRLGILIGDVSGKGLPAATLTSLVKNTIRAYAYQEDSPAAVMSKTNRIALRASAPYTFVTVFFGILDTESGNLVYCSAGHCPPILTRRSGGINILTTGSPAVGVIDHPKYVNSYETLEPADVLLLYTDGAIEARREREFFGEDRLIDILGNLETIETELLPQAVFSQVTMFTGGQLCDDLAILAVSLEGPSEHQGASAADSISATLTSRHLTSLPPLN